MVASRPVKAPLDRLHYAPIAPGRPLPFCASRWSPLCPSPSTAGKSGEMPPEPCTPDGVQPRVCRRTRRGRRRGLGVWCTSETIVTTASKSSIAAFHPGPAGSPFAHATHGGPPERRALAPETGQTRPAMPCPGGGGGDRGSVSRSRATGLRAPRNSCRINATVHRGERGDQASARCDVWGIATAGGHHAVQNIVFGNRVKRTTTLPDGTKHAVTTVMRGITVAVPA